MVLVTGNFRVWLVGVAASLVIFAVAYFAVIRPDQNTANQAIKSGMQQTQQALNQAQKQLGSAGTPASGVAQQQLSNATKLTACVSAAGTDATKLEACQTKFAK